VNSRSIFRAAAACAVFVVTVSTPAEAQFGAVRRAAQRAVSGAVQNTPANPASQPASAASQVNTGDVLELTTPVLDRFQRALDAERADLAQLAQRLGTIKTPEEYAECQLAWFQSAEGQAAYAKFNTVAAGEDLAATTAAAEELKGVLDRACGQDPAMRGQIELDAPAQAERAALAAGEFTAREFAMIKERLVPFCRVSAAAAEAGDGDVRLPGDGRDIYWVYTAAEAAALRERCGTLMEALAQTS